MQKNELHLLVNECLKALNESLSTMISSDLQRLPASSPPLAMGERFFLVHPLNSKNHESLSLVYECPLSTVLRIAAAFLEEEVTVLDEGSLDAIKELLQMSGNGLPSAAASLKLKMETPQLFGGALERFHLLENHLSIPLNVTKCGRMTLHVNFNESA